MNSVGGFVKPTPFRERSVRLATGVDALPLVHLQADLDGKQEVYNINAHGSTSKLRGKKEGSKKGLGLSWQRSKHLHNRTLINIGSIDPHDKFRKPMSEIFEDIQNYVGVEQPVISDYGVVHQNRYMNHIKCLDGIQEIYAHYQKFSNKAPILKRTLNIRIDNPREMIAVALYKNGVINSLQDAKIKRLRSILATDYYLFDDKSKGYDILVPEMLSFQKALKANKYWKYTAIPEPRRYLGTNNEPIYLYKLDGRPGNLFAF